MKFTAKKLSLAFAIFALLAVAGIVQAQETTQLIISPEPIKTSFGSEFSLQLSQTAFIEEYQITLQETLIKDITCIDGACPAAPAPIAVLTVLQEKGDLNYLVREKIYLNSGAEAEVLGIKIKSLANYPGSVRLVATKPSIPEPVPTPVMLYPKLGEEFKLSLRQQANIQENSQTVMKLILERIEVQEIQCFTTPCEPIAYAVLTASLPEAGVENFKVRLNSSSTLGVYEVHFTGVASDASSGVFAVKRISSTPPPEELIVVSLGQEFKFKEGQTAKVKETGLLAKLESVESTIVCLSTDCPPSEAIINLSVSLPPLKSLAILKMKAGEKATAYGHIIKVGGIDLQGKTASLVIVQETEPSPIQKTVYLNEKFKLSENETAWVLQARCPEGATCVDAVDYVSAAPILMKIKVLSIGLYACAEQTGSAASTYSTDLRCISGAFAKLELSSQSGYTETGTEAMVMEGKSVLFNGYEVSFLDSYISSTEKNGVFLVRKPAYSDYKKVSLDEKFRLYQSSITSTNTALVASEGVFIRLEGANEDSAKVFVWQGQADQRVLYKQAMPYVIKIGQELSISGLQIKLLAPQQTMTAEASPPWADFIVTKETMPGVINVHVNEPFKLKPEQAARVLEANLRIDVLGIVTVCSTCATNAEDSASPVCESYCFSTVQFSVSNYVFEKGYIGKEVEEKVIAATVVSYSTEERASEGISATEDTATEEKIIELPPTPWKTYSLQAGQSVVVGDFEIQVLSVTPERAEFKVVKRASGESFSYVLSQGWNLFSMPGDLQAESTNCESSNFKLFEYNAGSKEFDKVVNPVAGHAYWLYNSGKSCEAKAIIREAATLESTSSLEKGWNFVAVLPEMLGSKITDFGNCSLKSAFEWNAASKKWEKALTRALNNSDLGKALAVNALEACSLSGESTELPPMPE